MWASRRSGDADVDDDDDDVNSLNLWEFQLAKRKCDGHSEALKDPCSYLSKYGAWGFSAYCMRTGFISR
jgi:hypothetical protein